MFLFQQKKKDMSKKKKKKDMYLQLPKKKKKYVLVFCKNKCTCLKKEMYITSKPDELKDLYKIETLRMYCSSFFFKLVFM